MSDFNSCSTINSLKFSSYMLTEEALEKNQSLGFFWNLETNKRVVLPTNTHLRLLISAVDVLHSWTVPSFGVKVDACPGRLNQANLFIKRFGIFFGQCSEICWRLNMFNNAKIFSNVFIFFLDSFSLIKDVLLGELRLKQICLIKCYVLYSQIIKRPTSFVGKRLENSYLFEVALTC